VAQEDCGLFELLLGQLLVVESSVDLDLRHIVLPLGGDGTDQE
jgi:hypothetical protein